MGHLATGKWPTIRAAVLQRCLAVLTEATPEGTLTYTYDAHENLLTIASSNTNGASATYTYDALNRLASAKDNRIAAQGGPSNPTTYSYDPAGNLAGYAYPNTVQTGNVFNTLNRLTQTCQATTSPACSASSKLGSFTYTLGAAGNRTAVSVGITNTYDFENHMLKHGSVSMVYDGDGNRVTETAAGVTTKYLVDTLNPTGYSQVLDELVSGAVTRTYAYGLQRISENQVSGSTWTPTFYGYDGHGNVRFTTSATAAVGNTYTFDAFGAVIASTGTIANSYLYSGERFDSALNLYHLRARYYNMLTGRFETMDPGKETCCALRASQVGNIFDPATLHKYVYAQNNPVNRVDPSGKDAILDYAIELGEDEKTVEELRLVGLAVRDELVTACIEVNIAALEPEGIPTLQAYNLAKALCIALVD
jgi:RHS repeat-associated protein